MADIYADYKVVAAPSFKAGARDRFVNVGHLRVKAPKEQKTAKNAGYYYLTQSPFHPSKATANAATLANERNHGTTRYCGGKKYIIESILYGLAYPHNYTNPFGYNTLGTGLECLGVGKALAGGFGDAGGGGDEGDGSGRGRGRGVRGGRGRGRGIRGRGRGRGRGGSGRGSGLSLDEKSDSDNDDNDAIADVESEEDKEEKDEKDEKEGKEPESPRAAVIPHGRRPRVVSAVAAEAVPRRSGRPRAPTILASASLLGPYRRR